MEKDNKEVKKQKEPEWTRRADTMFFSLPPEYNEPMEFEEEDKLLLARLYIDSFKVLTYLEFTAIQALLLIQTVWDERPDPPTQTMSGYASTHEPRPLSLKAIHNVFGVDMGKMVALVMSALRKLPILETMIDPRIMKDFRNYPEKLKYSELAVNQKMFKFLGKEINTKTKRDNGVLTEPNSK